MSTLKDFDQFWDEQKKARPPGKEVEYTVLGKTYTLPTELPAGVMLRMIRLNKEQGPDANITDGEILEMSYDIFGKANVDDWCKQGIKAPQLVDLVVWAVAELDTSISGNRQRRRAKTAATTPRRNGKVGISTSSKTGQA